MTHPTLLSPWFVVFRMDSNNNLEYYASSDQDVPSMFTSDPKRAMLFMSMSSASRVSITQKAWTRVLFNDDEMKEFRNA